MLRETRRLHLDMIASRLILRFGRGAIVWLPDFANRIDSVNRGLAFRVDATVDFEEAKSIVIFFSILLQIKFCILKCIYFSLYCK